MSTFPWVCSILSASPAVVHSFLNAVFLCAVFQAVDNPSYTEIRDVCVAAEMVLGVEVSFPRLKLRSEIRDVCVMYT